MGILNKLTIFKKGSDEKQAKTNLCAELRVITSRINDRIAAAKENDEQHQGLFNPAATENPGITSSFGEEQCLPPSPQSSNSPTNTSNSYTRGGESPGLGGTLDLAQISEHAPSPCNLDTTSKGYHPEREIMVGESASQNRFGLHGDGNSVMTSDMEEQFRVTTNVSGDGGDGGNGADRSEDQEPYRAQQKGVFLLDEAGLDRRRCRKMARGLSLIAPSTTTGPATNPPLGHSAKGVQERIWDLHNVLHTDPRDIRQLGLNSFNDSQHVGIAKRYGYVGEDEVRPENALDAAVMDVAKALKLLKSQHLPPAINQEEKMTTEEACKRLAVSSVLEKWCTFMDMYIGGEHATMPAPQLPFANFPEAPQYQSGTHPTFPNVQEVPNQYTEYDNGYSAASGTNPTPTQRPVAAVPPGFQAGDRGQAAWEEFDANPTPTERPVAAVPPGFQAEDRGQAAWEEFDANPMINDPVSGGLDRDYSHEVNEDLQLPIEAHGGIVLQTEEAVAYGAEASNAAYQVSEFDWNDEELGEEIRMHNSGGGVPYTTGGSSDGDSGAPERSASTIRRTEWELVEDASKVTEMASKGPIIYHSPYSPDSVRTYLDVCEWVDRVFLAMEEDVDTDNVPSLGTVDLPVGIIGAQGPRYPARMLGSKVEGRGSKVVNEANGDGDPSDLGTFRGEGSCGVSEVGEGRQRGNESDSEIGREASIKMAALRRLALDAEQFETGKSGVWEGWKRGIKCHSRRIGRCFGKE